VATARRGGEAAAAVEEGKGAGRRGWGLQGLEGRRTRCSGRVARAAASGRWEGLGLRRFREEWEERAAGAH
jgi:hypothetical protein